MRRSEFGWLLLVSACAALVFALAAAQKPFWYDEIFTLAIAGQPLGSAMWAAMTAGFEFNPPMNYLLTHATESILGRGEITSRLPSIASAVLCLPAIYLILCHRYSASIAFFAIGALLATSASEFAVEARSYSLLIFATAGAWACWQRARDQSSGRLPYLAGLTAFLWLAALAHMWSLAVFGSLLVAEIIPNYQRRRLDVSVVGAIIAGGLPFGLYPALLQTLTRVVNRGPIYQADVGKLARAYVQHVHWLWIPAVILIAFAAVAILRRKSDTVPFGLLGRVREFIRPFVQPDGLFALLLCLVPIEIYLAAAMGGAPYFYRYSLPFTLGAAYLLSVLAHETFQTEKIRARAGGLCLVAVLGTHGFVAAFAGTNGEQTFETRVSGLDLSMPIVVENGLFYCSWGYYLNENSPVKLRYVADRKVAVQQIGTDGIDGPLLFAQPYLPVRGSVVPLQTFLARNDEFYVICDYEGSPMGWICGYLKQQGWGMTKVQGHSLSRLFRVSPPDQRNAGQ